MGTEDGADRPGLGDVSPPRSRGVRIDVSDGLGRDSGLGKGLAHREPRPGPVGRRLRDVERVGRGAIAEHLGEDGSAERRPIGRTLHYYDGEAFTGLAVGRLGDHGALARTERLAFTPAMLREAYRSPGAPEEPPFLAPSAAPPWTDDYPAELRERLPALAGYTYRDGEGYYVCAERNRYDFQAGASARGLMTARRDPLGRDTAIAYDRYGLAPVRVEDPVGLVSEA